MENFVTGSPVNPAIDIRRLGFSFGAKTILNDLSIRIESGEIHGFLGPNGAGKTTLMRILTGHLRPNVGTVELFGERLSPKSATRIGYMPQLSALYQEISAQQNVDFFASMYGLSDSSVRREAVESALSLVNLWDERRQPLFQLSGGMRQRVSLAVAMVHKPSLLLLDEPTVGLDPELRATFWDHFRQMADSGTTLVLSSHTMDDASHCDRLSFLQEGQFVATGTPSELTGSVGKPGTTLEDAFLYFVRKR